MTEIPFPVFTWAPPGAATAEQVRLLGAAWAASGGADRVPTRATGPGDVVFLSASADLDARRTGPRAYLAADFLGAALASAAETTAGDLRQVLARSSWGTLTLLVDRGPASVASAAELTAALARHWDELDALVYVHTVVRPVTLTEVVALDLGGLLATWLGRAGDSLTDDLTTAAAAMRAADPAERRDRVVARLAELAATNPRIQHREELTDTGRLGDLYDARDRAERDALAAGDDLAALTLLYRVDRHL